MEALKEIWLIAIPLLGIIRIWFGRFFEGMGFSGRGSRADVTRALGQVKEKANNALCQILYFLSWWLLVPLPVVGVPLRLAREILVFYRERTFRHGYRMPTLWISNLEQDSSKPGKAYIDDCLKKFGYVSLAHALTWKKKEETLIEQERRKHLGANSNAQTNAVSLSPKNLVSTELRVEPTGERVKNEKQV